MTARGEFGLLLFATDPSRVRRATDARVSGFVVDWEHIGKEDRQRGADTQINHDTADDLRRVRAATPAGVLCRVNRLGPWTPREVDEAIAAGADEILLPMARDVETVTQMLRLCGDRVRLGILVETAGAVACARELGRLPVSRVYVGLNDLMLDRGSPHLFHALADGTLDRIRDAFAMPFGFGGLTLPERGAPLPCRLLVAEMARLGCDFTFLRRSFVADVPDAEFGTAVPRIRGAIETARRRDAAEVEGDRRCLSECLAALPGRTEVSA